MENFVTDLNMDLMQLPVETKLYQLVQGCIVSHELTLVECADGALIMECWECPIHYVLTDQEETCLRAQQVEDAIQQSSQSPS